MPNVKNKNQADVLMETSAAGVGTSTTPTRSKSEEKPLDDDEGSQEGTQPIQANKGKATETRKDGGDKKKSEAEEGKESLCKPAAMNLNPEFTLVTGKKKNQPANKSRNKSQEKQQIMTNPYAKKGEGEPKPATGKGATGKGEGEPKPATGKGATGKGDTHPGRGGQLARGGRCERGGRGGRGGQSLSVPKVTQETPQNTARKGKQSDREGAFLKQVAENKKAEEEAKKLEIQKRLVAIAEARKKKVPQPTTASPSPETNNQESKKKKKKEKEKSVGFKPPEREPGSTMSYPPHGPSLEPARSKAFMINIKFNTEASKSPTKVLVEQVKEFVEALQLADPTLIIHRWLASEPDQVFTDSIEEPSQVMNDVHSLRNFFPEIKSWSIGGWQWSKALIAFDTLANVQELKNKMLPFLEIHNMDLNEMELQATHPVEAGWLMYSLRSMDVDMHKKELEEAIKCSVGLRWHKVKPMKKWDGVGEAPPAAYALHISVDDKFKQFSVVRIKRLYATRNYHRQATPLGVRMRFITHIDRLYDKKSRVTYVTAISRQRAFEKGGCLMMTLRDVKTMDKSMLTHLHNPNTGTNQRLPHLLGKSVDTENQEKYNEEERSQTAPMDIRHVLMNLRSTVDGKQLFHSIDPDDQSGGFRVSVIRSRELEASAHIDGVVPMLRFYYGDTFDKHFPSYALNAYSSMEWDPTKRCVKSHLDMDVEDTFDPFDDDMNAIGEKDQTILEAQLREELKEGNDNPVVIVDFPDPDGDDSFASLHSTKSLNSMGDISGVASWVQNFTPDVEPGQTKKIKRLTTETDQGKTKKAKIANPAPTNMIETASHATQATSTLTTETQVVEPSAALGAQLQYYKEALHATLGPEGFQMVEDGEEPDKQEDLMTKLRALIMTEPESDIANMSESDEDDDPDRKNDENHKDQDPSKEIVNMAESDEDDDYNSKDDGEEQHPTEMNTEQEPSETIDREDSANSEDDSTDFEDDEGQSDRDQDDEDSSAKNNEVDEESQYCNTPYYTQEEATSVSEDQPAIFSDDERATEQEPEPSKPTMALEFDHDKNNTAESIAVLPTSPTDAAIDSGRDG
jgi:hypothetical protein